MSLPILTAWLLALAVLAMPTGFFWCCCACTALVTVQVQGCNSLGLDGELVTIKQGGTTVATGTTAGGGFVAFELPVGSYTAEIAAPTGFAAFSPASFDVEAGCDPVSVTLALSTDTADYVCCPSSARPIPKDMIYTDANGGGAMTFYDGGSTKHWYYCYTITSANTYTFDPFTGCVGPASGPVAIGIHLYCDSFGLHLVLTFFVVPCVSGAFTYCYYDGNSSCATVGGVPLPAGSNPINVNPTGVVNSLPVSFTGSWPTNSGSVCSNGNILTPVTGAFSIAP